MAIELVAMPEIGFYWLVTEPVSESPTAAGAMLADAASRAPGHEIAMPIREFIGYWGAMRRGSWVVERIRDTLQRHQLTTVPSFENGWIDNTIVLMPSSRARSHPGVEQTVDVAVEDVGPAGQVTSTALRFADLPTADAGVVSVPREVSVRHAQSVMIQNDFSQLPVVNGRDLHGAISWESISRARMHKPDAALQEVLVSATVVSLDDEVLPHVSDIIRRGFVFVRRRDRVINGIVTTTDLSAAYKDLAGPFLLVGDVERRLRRIITTHFTIDEVRSVKSPDDIDRTIESVENMTAGEYIWLLDNDERWARLGWDVDRKIFAQSLQAYRTLRNEVMHFSPDPLDGDKLLLVENLLAWLRTAVPDVS